MAELHVQRKEGSMWPWLIAALLVVALLAWFFWGREDDRDLTAADGSTDAVVAIETNEEMTGFASETIAGTAVAEFLQFGDGSASGTMSVDHNYTADGLRQLAAALDEIAGDKSVGGVALQPRIQEIRDRANALQNTASSNEHALQTREAFVLASTVLMRMDSDKGGADSDLSGLQNTAMEIKPTVPLLEQGDAVKNFFAQAKQAVRGMTNEPV